MSFWEGSPSGRWVELPGLRGDWWAPNEVSCAGRILDELLQTCVDPQDCPVCEVAGRRLAPGKKITLSPDDPAHCQNWYGRLVDWLPPMQALRIWALEHFQAA